MQKWWGLEQGGRGSVEEFAGKKNVGVGAEEEREWVGGEGLGGGGS